MYDVQKALLLPVVAPNGDQRLLEAIILAVYNAGVDEIIANSLGEIRTVRRLGIDVALTASDLVCCYCVQDAMVLKDYGVSMVRLSPELSFKQVSALASGTPVALQMIVHGRITLGVLQEFSCFEACAYKDVPFVLCSENGSKALFQIYGAEIVSARCLNLLEHIADLKEAGISNFFVDARYLAEGDIKTICAAFGQSPPELANAGDAVIRTKLTQDLEAIPSGCSFCNGWFHGKPGIGDFR
jgi:collagenase-like PrtC family protease